jgi:hypothetical protein
MAQQGGYDPDQKCRPLHSASAAFFAEWLSRDFPSPWTRWTALVSTIAGRQDLVACDRASWKGHSCVVDSREASQKYRSSLDKFQVAVAPSCDRIEELVPEYRADADGEPGR